MLIKCSLNGGAHNRIILKQLWAPAIIRSVFMAQCDADCASFVLRDLVVCCTCSICAPYTRFLLSVCGGQTFGRLRLQTFVRCFATIVCDFGGFGRMHARAF